MSPTEVSMYNHHFGLSLVIHPVPIIYHIEFRHHFFFPISCTSKVLNIIVLFPFHVPQTFKGFYKLWSLYIQQKKTKKKTEDPYHRNFATKPITKSIQKKHPKSYLECKDYHQNVHLLLQYSKEPTKPPILGPQKEELTGEMKYVQQNYVVQLVGSGHREETWHPCRIWIQISLEPRTNLWVATGHPAVYTLGYWFWYLFFIQIDQCYMVHHLDWHNLQRIS